MKIFYIILVWVIYFGGWIVTWKTNNGMLFFVMAMLSITFYPMILTGLIIDHYDNLKIKQL
jgi:hypothetical protein